SEGELFVARFSARSFNLDAEVRSSNFPVRAPARSLTKCERHLNLLSELQAVAIPVGCHAFLASEVTSQLDRVPRPSPRTVATCAGRWRAHRARRRRCSS